jgi:hypothetical protein
MARRAALLLLVVVAAPSPSPRPHHPPRCRDCIAECAFVPLLALLTPASPTAASTGALRGSADHNNRSSSEVQHRDWCAACTSTCICMPHHCHCPRNTHTHQPLLLAHPDSPVSIASASFSFHCLATFSSSGSSGLGALSSAWMLRGRKQWRQRRQQRWRQQQSRHQGPSTHVRNAASCGVLFQPDPTPHTPT